MALALDGEQAVFQLLPEAGGGPVLDGEAGALGDLAKAAWKDKHWDESASLYHKAVMAWETASDNCTGVRQQQAQKKIEQTQLDEIGRAHV